MLAFFIALLLCAGLLFTGIFVYLVRCAVAAMIADRKNWVTL